MNGSFVFCQRASILTITVVTLILTGCMEKVDHPSLFDPSVTPLRPDPTLSAILPSDSALAGVDTLVMTGADFSVVPTENTVHFDAAMPQVLSATATQLTMIAPY